MRRYIRLLLVGMFVFSCVGNVSANDYSVQTYIPKNFHPLKDSVKESVLDIMSETISKEELNDEILFLAYFSGLIEHENCISLKYNSCWSPKTQFKTKWKNGLNREQGAGLLMITRAWRSSGALRFDNVYNLRRKYPKELHELTWDNIIDRPDLQIKAGILLYRESFIKLPNHISTFDKIAMSDSAYNGGFSYILKDRRICGLKANCDPDIWFSNVATINNRGSRILYGSRTAHDINRHHVEDVLMNRLAKYYEYYIRDIYDY